MRMPRRLWLLSFLAGLLAAPAFAQSPDIMHVDPAVQRERDATRQNILQDELAKETRELDAAQTELRNTEASRATSDKVREITARVTLHRQNLSALEREISLAQRPAEQSPNFAIRVTAKRQPDNWLIAGRQLATGEPNRSIRRRLPLADAGAGLPPWIIQAGFTGLGP